MCIQATKSTGAGGKSPVKIKAIIKKGSGRRSDLVYEGLEPTASILDLKKLMQEREGILHTGLNLFLHFIEVDNNMLLHHYAQGQDTLKLTMILQQRGQWVPEAFFVKKHEEELTSFNIQSRQSLNVKAGIFKITQSVTKNEMKFCKVYTYKIDSDCTVNFFRKEGNIAYTTNRRDPPKTVVSIGDEEIKPIKKEEFRLRSETDSLDEKLAFNYNLLTTVTDVPFPPRGPATSEKPGAVKVLEEPQWVVLNDVVINEETLGILLTGKTQKPTQQSPIRRQSDQFDSPQEKDVINTNKKKPKEEKRKKPKDGNIQKSKQKTRSERKGVIAKGRAMLARWKKTFVYYGRKLKALFCRPIESKNEGKYDMV